MLTGTDVHQGFQKRADQRDHLRELRRRIADLEGRLPSEARFDPAPVSAAMKQGPVFSQGTGAQALRLRFGIEALDAVFRDYGLRLATLHEVVGEQSRDCGAVSGFALALVARIMRQRKGMVLWVAGPEVVREEGRFHGPGLVQFGLNPGRVLAVFPRRMEDLLWVLEEGARCASLAGVLGEVQGMNRLLDLTATRRLLLRAQTSGVPVLLLRHGVAEEPTAALTRWCISPRASKAPDLLRHGPHEAVGRPEWMVNLTRNREGRSENVNLEWNHETGQFAAPARALALVSGPAGQQDLEASEFGTPEFGNAVSGRIAAGGGD